MILVVGGVASGKRVYVESLGLPADECAFDVHELLRDGISTVDGSTTMDDFVDALSLKAAVTCAEVGSGIVPLSAEERAWRERVGACMQALAARADRVVRMVCGIPMDLKSPTAIPLELVIIRHGQTPGNAARRYVGQADEPLSALGRQQAQVARDGGAAADLGEVNRVYVSKMRRARETAALMFPEAEQVVVEGVQEMNFGTFSGRSADEMEQDAAYRTWVESDCRGRCPGGEDRAEFEDRVCAAVERLCREAASRGERRVVLVAHGGTIMASFDRFVEDDRPYYGWLVGNCEARGAQVSFPDGCLRFEPL